MSVTAYPALERELQRQIKEAQLDHGAFQIPLKICDLTKCRATCCHDGVYLSHEEVSVIEGIKDRITDYGIHRSSVIVEREGRKKSTTVRASDSQLANGFPEHFPKTKCVFLDQENRCVLQRMAVDDGLDPWWWKPISCWMHPLLFRYTSNSRPTLTLEQSDNHQGKGFGCFTPCGMPATNGQPAWQTLRRELELLGTIGNRDILGELSR